MRIIANQIIENIVFEEASIFEIAIVMLRMDTVRDIGIILRDHSYLNDYWKKQIQYLFNEKL